MKTKLLKFTLGITCFCSLIMLSACDSSAIPVEPNGCVWVNDSIYVEFHHALFKYPSKDCSLDFEKNNLNVSDSIEGVYNFMHEMAGNPDVSSCNLTWLSSIYTKKCDSYNLESNNARIQLDLTNYYSNLYSTDVLEPAPIVRYDCQMLPEDYKHQLIIQIPGVYNGNDGSTGTLTWLNTWLGETDSYYSSVNHGWDFYCPVQGMTATYTPDFGFLREVYVYNQFLFIY